MAVPAKTRLLLAVPALAPPVLSHPVLDWLKLPKTTKVPVLFKAVVARPNLLSPVCTKLLTVMVLEMSGVVPDTISRSLGAGPVERTLHVPTTLKFALKASLLL